MYGVGEAGARAMGFACARKRLREARAAVKKTAATPRQQKEKAGDELQELARTFEWTVERVSSLMRDLDAAHQRTLEAEKEKREFYREVIRAVTGGKFDLVEEEAVPEIGKLVFDTPVRDGAGYARARDAIAAAARQVG